MGRIIVFIYGLVCYLIFVATFLYAIGFTENMVVPQSIDSGPSTPLGEAILINALLLSLFVVQHTVMARPAFKAWWTRFVPKPAERSTFVLATCVALGLVFWQWRPVTAVVWEVQNATLANMLIGISLAGYGLVLYTSFCIDHFDLFGLRQVVLYLQSKPYTHPPFAQPLIYRLVRNPLMLGFLIAFWVTPTMTQGHLIFCVLTTGYILMGIAFEERDLGILLGDDYRRYRARTPMLLPIPKSGKTVPAEDSCASE